MPRDELGNYSLPPSYFVRVGDDVLPSQHNPPFEDIAQALTGSVARSGVGSMNGPLNMNGNGVLNVSSLTGDAIMAAGDLREAATGKLLSTNRVWDEATSHDLGNLTGNVQLDFNEFLGLAHGVITGNVTLGQPVNAKPGQTVVLDIWQDGSGGRSIVPDRDFWVTVQGSAIGWTTTAGVRNLLVASVLGDGKVLLQLAAANIR